MSLEKAEDHEKIDDDRHPAVLHVSTHVRFRLDADLQ
jgi:hypothetical protein